MRGRIFGRIARLLLGAVLLLTVLTGCGEGSPRVVFTTGFAEDELFRIGSVSCTVPEFMVYLTNTQNQYEQVYGDRIWQVEYEGETLEDNVKETVLAKIAQIKTMYLLARDRGVALDEEEKDRVGQAARTYFDSLSQQEAEILGVDCDLIEGLYREYAMAQKIYRQIVADINPEISDDEARTVTVEHILLRTYAVDGAGNRVEYSPERKAQVYGKAQEILAQAREEGQDFLELAARFSEDEQVTYSFRKGEMDPDFEEAACELGAGEISQVVETRSGYHIIKCITAFDREETDANKIRIVEERRNEAFGREYDAFVETLARTLNEDLWGQMELIRDPEVTTASFFQVFQQAFPDETF